MKRGRPDHENHRLGSFPSWGDDTGDELSALLIQPGLTGAHEHGASAGFPPGPGLSAVEMAAACLCLAEDAWNVDVDAIRSVGQDPGAAGRSSN